MRCSTVAAKTADTSRWWWQRACSRCHHLCIDEGVTPTATHVANDDALSVFAKIAAADDAPLVMVVQRSG
jgi:hypothetical protein